ncbi:MAG: AAA family ATPase, partial [Lautropia sp.]
GMTAFRDGARVIVIDPADALSPAAANALLKRLEEPGERTVFLLVTHRPDRLPATVRSRCRTVTVPRPEPAAALAWLAAAAAVPAADAAGLLAFAGGAPLHARELADPANLTAYRALLEAIGAVPDTADIIVAERLGTMSATQWYPVLQRWIGDLIRVRAGAAPRFFPESASRLGQLARRSSLAALTQAAIRLQRQANLTRHPLNPRMFAEAALATYADAFAARNGT